MSLRLGETKIKGVNLPSYDFIKAFFDAGGKCGYSKATSFDGAIPFTATSDVTDMNRMFYYCKSLTSVPLFNTSKVTNMSNMFEGCSRLTSVPLFNTVNVTDMSFMFKGCSSLTSVTLFNTVNVTDMNFMFDGCSRLTSIPSFDVSKVTYMNSTFRDCSSLETIHMINIGTSLEINSSTKFTREALLEIIGNLKTVTRTKTLMMGTANLAKLTDEDKAIATNKGWSLA